MLTCIWIRSAHVCTYCKCNFTDERIICVDCESVNGILHTVDFCSKPGCLGSTIRASDRDRHDLLKPHVPTHDLIKVRRNLLQRQLAQAFVRAKNVLTEFRTSFKASGIGRQDTEYADSPRCCSGCKIAIEFPCWYCLECLGKSECATYTHKLTPPTLDSDVFICTICDATKIVVDNVQHEKHHTLVRCRDNSRDIEILSMEENIWALNDRLLRVEEYVKSIQRVERHVEEHNQRLLSMEGHVQAINERQSRVEEMLKTILEKVGSASTNGSSHL